MADEKPKSNSEPKIPSNWTPDGLSKGKQTGAVRPSHDAYQGPRKSKP